VKAPALALLALLATASGCRSAPQAPASASAGAQDAPPPIRFIENDYAFALSEARARHVPLLVDAWAPWCHACLSMRAFVFTDESLRRVSTRFVWLSLDTEREDNAPVVSKLDVRVLPTLFVIDSASDQVALAWPGSLTARELAALLDDAYAGAGPRGPLAVDALVTRLSDDKRLSECVSTGADEAPRMPPGTALADVLRCAIGCAEDLPAEAPERGRLTELAALGERVVSDASQPILADDRSDLYDYVVGALRELGRTRDAKRLARAWASFLEGEAARASTPAARVVFDAHRLLAYLAIDQPQRALPMLKRSERDFPSDYNAPARLGAAYLAMKRYDDALAASSRALERAYGPRKLRLWSLQTDILLAKGDTPGARLALRAAIDFAKTVPLTGSYPRFLETLEKRLADLR
jgi:tetratricopeptide (TPR) repeat protein